MSTQSKSPTDPSSPPPPWTPADTQRIGFTKAAFVFKEELDDIRSKKSPLAAPNDALSKKLKSQSTGYVREDVEMPPPPPPANSYAFDPTERDNRRIRILRAVQHTLTSVLSITIAVLQGLTYAKYQRTKDVPNAWPTHPTLFPTLLLMIVAIMALAFDISSLIAYFMPGKRIAERAFRLTVKIHYWITAVKSMSYAIAAAVCRTGFSVGNQKDLWGWSCSAQGKDMSSVNDAMFNCAGNTAAWVLSILNIAIEVLGVLVTFCVTKRDSRTPLSMPTTPAGGTAPNATRSDSMSNPLLVRYAALDGQADDVHGQLEGLGPGEKS
jgi:hypothetical protein